MRRLMVGIFVVVAALAAVPASGATPAAMPAKSPSGTWYFVDKTPACNNGGGPYECGWAWMLQISGKRVRSIFYSPQGNAVTTNGWARLQDRRIKGICTNSFQDWACDAARVFAHSGRPLAPAGGKRVSRAVAMGQYPSLTRYTWEPFTAHQALGGDPIELVACANNTTKLAGQLRREGKVPSTRRAKAEEVRVCHGRWAWIAPVNCAGDCAYVAHKVKGRWRFAFGIPATESEIETAPGWIYRLTF
jgi:hypothetical protein